MKKIVIGFVVVFSVLVLSGFLIKDNDHDPRLVGIWKGSEKDKQVDGVEKHWILQRFENGKYIIMFTMNTDCRVQTSVEKGEWWTKDGKFYETSDGVKDTDEYDYEINGSKVTYKSIKLNGEKRDDYNFTDYKVEVN